MGMMYDKTPPSDWITSKIFAEYAIRLVNDYIRQESSMAIPMPICRAFACNLQRAVESLPASMTSGDEVKRARVALDAALEPLLSEKMLRDGRLDGALPVTVLGVAVARTRDLFAHAYAQVFHRPWLDFIAYNNPCTKEGIIYEWDENLYKFARDDPNPKITPWDAARKQAYRETLESGWIMWETNETEIFSELCFDGWHAGHSIGSGNKNGCRTIATDFSLLGVPRDVFGQT